ncbi:PREDICTED: biorientation of chromosomes in cell division protein 1-like 2 [Colobus angolensis palliatus]|uniref:biorientation of chromosomes in cell division protein 1-like 2 n=1 Tax=Colobus angolensis palliatus TaxID=336983 RepID=UPI0005F54D33|nr:PREDICTED: biorientation of chromosomes in cell division protein 1-like 2 [Colobus angolensis palliatus]
MWAEIDKVLILYWCFPMAEYQRALNHEFSSSGFGRDLTVIITTTFIIIIIIMSSAAAVVLEGVEVVNGDAIWGALGIQQAVLPRLPQPPRPRAGLPRGCPNHHPRRHHRHRHLRRCRLGALLLHRPLSHLYTLWAFCPGEEAVIVFLWARGTVMADGGGGSGGADNFVSAHLDKQEWNPSVNENQLRDGLRQTVVQPERSEAGVDRIISQVVDPKLNHIFRPHIEQAIHEFLVAQKEVAVLALSPEPEGLDPPAPSQDTS